MHTLGIVDFLLAIVSTFVVTIAYNLFFHPLHQFPGPWYSRSSRLWYFIKTFQGTLHFEVKLLHDKYGDVVRIAPDELSYINGDAWQEIHGRQKSSGGKMKDNLLKDPTFWGALYDSDSDVRVMPKVEGDEFNTQKKSLAYPFSTKGILSQEHISASHINLLTTTLEKRLDGSPTTVVGIDSWLSNIFLDNAYTFVIGRSPGAFIERPDITHSTIDGFTAAWKFFPYYALFKRLPKFICVALELLASRLLLTTYDCLGPMQELIQVRLDEEIEGSHEHNDVASYIFPDQKFKECDIITMKSTCAMFILATTETSTTFLCGFFYSILRNPSTLEVLVQEIRRSFKSKSEISYTSTENLQYLQACMNEALRVYPPVVTSLPRITPSGGAIICNRYVPKNTIVGMFHWAVYRNAKNFGDPDSFRPERWLDENSEVFVKDKRKAFHPFGFGHRTCIGQQVSSMTTRLYITHLLWQFDFELDPRSVDWMDQTGGVLPHRDQPLFVKLKNRDCEDK